MGMVMKTFPESAALWRQIQIIPQEGQGSRDKGRRTRHAKAGFGAPAQHRCLRTASEGGLTTLPKEGAGEEAIGYANGLA
jgi:hypothetical protein